jgi:hypothetical protein
VRIFHVVLFLNGEYQGLYQISERVDRHLLGLPAYRAGEADPGLIFKAQDSTATFTRPVLGAYRQIEPDPGDADKLGELAGFLSFVGSADSRAFAAEISRRLDQGSFLDYLLLTNVANNFEGVNYNFYLARDPGPGRPFFFVPWDFDKAYRGKSRGRLNNHLSHRLLEETPGFADRLQRRWRELRAGALSDAAVDARIARYEAEIGPSAEVDRRRWRAGEMSHREGVEQLGRWLHARLSALDAAIARGDAGANRHQRRRAPRLRGR